MKLTEHHVTNAELDSLIAAWQNSKIKPHEAALRAFLELKQRRAEDRQRENDGK
jgi:hypothetical protein